MFTQGENAPSKYVQALLNNVLPLSQSSVLSEALKEWEYHGEMEDYGSACEVCWMCDQKGLRFHFKIENQHTGKELWVGSKCIVRYKVPVWGEDGQALFGAFAEKELGRQMAVHQKKTCLKWLDSLLLCDENNASLEKAVAHYAAEGALSPKLAAIVFQALEHNNVEHKATLFKIALRKKSEKQELVSLSQKELDLVWPALSLAQKDKARDDKILPSSAPPPSYQSKGQIELLDSPYILAVVGGERVSNAALLWTQKTAQEAAESGWVIISGLARGCDLAGHLGCYKGQGRTIAAIATDFDHFYPPEHEKLQRRIGERDLLLSPAQARECATGDTSMSRDYLIAQYAHAILISAVGNSQERCKHITEIALRAGKLVFIGPDCPVYTWMGRQIIKVDSFQRLREYL